MSDRHSDRWGLPTALTLGLAGIGIVTVTPTLVAAAIVPLWLVAYGALTGWPSATLRIERSIDEQTADPGEQVTVRLTVENAGRRPIADCRIVDGVPDDLLIVDGTPRACLALGVGDRETIEYTVAVQRGEHVFEEPAVRIRNVSGTAVRTGSIEPDGDRRIDCILPVEEVPVGTASVGRSGRVPSDETGAGIEFHSVRKYRRGDPMRFVDWRRFARTGELTTVEYRVESAADVIFVIDARPESWVTADEMGTDVVDVSAYAAERAAEALVDVNHPVGLAGIGAREIQYLAPGRGVDHLAELHDELLMIRRGRTNRRRYLRPQTWHDPALITRRLERRFPGEGTVLLFSPVLDHIPGGVAKTLAAHGYAVTVVSPDSTAGDGADVQLMAVKRYERLLSMEAAGVQVVDWSLDRPLSLVLGEALAQSPGVTR